jgi:hypothetical protein
VLNRITSCNNHERFVLLELWKFGETNNGALPYDPGASGFEFIARFSASSDAHVNCNHGSDDRIGGWQAVNLSPQLWSEVVKRWNLRERPIPVVWCGKPTGVGQRVVTSAVSYRHETGFYLGHFNMNEDELEIDLVKLNGILISLGKAPVDLNVPDGIDWAKWDVQRSAIQNQSRKGSK